MNHSTRELILLALIVVGFLVGLLFGIAIWHPDSVEYEMSLEKHCEPSECEPEIVEKIIEKPVKEIVSIPVDKIITQTTESPVNEQLKLEISEWEQAFNSLKPDIYKLTTLISYQELADLYEKLWEEHSILWRKYIVDTGLSLPQINFKQEAPDPEKCIFTTTMPKGETGYYPKGKIVCEWLCGI